MLFDILKLFVTSTFAGARFLETTLDFFLGFVVAGLIVLTLVVFKFFLVVGFPILTLDFFLLTTLTTVFF